MAGKKDQRWTEVSASPFTHEVEGLNRVKAILPNAAPFRAWSNFEFRDGHGKWHEIDLLVLGRRRLHLVELKYYNGTLRGDDHRWLRDGKRAEDSPLKLARRKAQRLASKLQDELRNWARENGHQIPDVRDVVPFVQESVFLHHPDMRCALSASAQIDLYGIDGNESRSGLPGISERLLEPPNDRGNIGGNRDAIIAALVAQIGVVQRREREVGSWVIDEEPLGEGDGWQDWPAHHKVTRTDRHRVRFFVTPPGAPTEQRTKVRRVAEHEYRVMSRLAHDGLLRPRDLVDDELGIGLVYPEDTRLQRLDLWMADQTDGVSLSDQLALVRQVAEALAYAHANRIVHRGLTPKAVHVRRTDTGSLKVVVGDWQSAGTTGTDGTGLSTGVTGLLGVDEVAAARLGAIASQGDADQHLAEAFEAPEGVWNAQADRVRLDVFAIGALAYFILTGRPAATDRTSLRARLLRDEGLDPTADLSQVPSTVRALVKAATHPKVTDRTPDVRTFLKDLSEVEQGLNTEPDDDADPLDAAPGAVLAGRYELKRRLGAGSTAVGLLVTDLISAETRVLKVALNEAAAVRLADEAEVLGPLNDPRLVKLIEGPIDVGGRSGLLLESAGEETLGEVLRGRGRLSLDLLERWGDDLLQALVALDKAGVDHRDIKPSNLGVREGRGDRVKHLVLFDFSLSRASANALSAGTAPYLDPFLDSPGRGRYDSAAERYAVSVVLFEMAAGTTPAYGDGLTHPGSVPDEATVTEDLFDPSVAPALVTFFRRALARDAGARFDTARELQGAWRSAFAPLPTTVPEDADARADAAEPSTPLSESGLSARGLSALEPYRLATVGDLVALDPVRLNRLAGVAEPTRKEVKDRARRWRERLGALVTGRGSAPEERDERGLPSPVDAADLLLEHAGGGKAEGRRAAARLILGLDDGLDAFASQTELSAALGVTRARASQQVAGLQDAWAKDGASRDLLDALATQARQSLTTLGNVATVEELTQVVLTSLATMTRPEDGPSPERLAAGLLRLALDRVQAQDRADAGAEPLSSRRRNGRLALLATEPRLLDAAEALGRAADDLVAQAQQHLVPSAKAVEVLDEKLRHTAPGQVSPALAGPRLLRLGTALASHAALSGGEELHDRDLTHRDALAIALRGVGGGQPIGAQEMRDRVRARFPALASLPDRPRLDQLVDEAGLSLVYVESERAYRSPTRAADTTGLVTRIPTFLGVAGGALPEAGHLGHRLAESRERRSFLALGVDGMRLDMAADVLCRDYNAVALDVTEVLVTAMRAAAAQVGLDWDVVRAADAAAAGSRDAQGLTTLVKRALPALDEAIQAVSSEAEEASRPVLLIDASTLARYDHLSALARWTDLTSPRRQAVWLLVPQLYGSQGPVLDARPVPLAAPGQYVRLDKDWLDSQSTRGVPA